MTSSLLLKFYLIDSLDEFLLGSFMDDYPVTTDITFSDKIKDGMAFQKSLNELFYSSDFFKESERILDFKSKKFSHRIIPVFADHFAASNWDKMSSQVDLKSFSVSMYEFLQKNKGTVPFKYAQLIGLMSKYDWLSNFKTIHGMHQIIRMRTKRHNFNFHMEEGLNSLVDQYSNSHKLFFELIAELKEFTANYRASHNLVLAC